MQHSLTYDNERSYAGNRSARHGSDFWLLLGAAALGLLFFVAPYCHGLIAKAAGAPAAIERIAYAAGLHASCIARSGNRSCRSAATTRFVRPDAASVPDRADFPGPVAAAAQSLQRHSNTEHSFLFDPPPVGTPLYLRHQRFLI